MWLLCETRSRCLRLILVLHEPRQRGSPAVVGRCRRGLLLNFMYHKKISPRTECRQRENLRLQASATLADTYRELKSLTVNVAHFSPGGQTKTSEMKYTINLISAKSLFRIDCSNQDCVAGDFDLSTELANAVRARHEIATGEVTCNGWHSQHEIDRVRCNRILRYTLSVGFGQETGRS